MACATGLRMTSLVDHIRHWLWLSEFEWSISTATDLTITASFVFHLHQQRKEIHKSSRTAALVDKLILWTIDIYLAFFMLEAQVFSNSILANLNSRETLRKMDEREISLQISSIVFQPTEMTDIACG
ncbi:hypothetical protein DFH08DRAFT_824534 [Mycena albidolilacea]|uniref:DUF6534 domain-containing protein n=1 Tax=Mycena albidolilacea TaxID=1033008 RepID=A0AAD6Z4B9_9AGAR|nr:hypothetical protein DFH08DRAFT_824534 [Mycena albidolilacea]